MDLIYKTAEKITAVQIQGATNVAKEALLALKSYSFGLEGEEDFRDKIQKAAQILKNSRPTEPLMHNGLDFTVQGKTSLEIEKLVDEFLSLINRSEEKIIILTQEILNGKNTVLTHCHSETVVQAIKKAHQINKHLKVFITETRPLLQGQETARDLLSAGIETTMITDARVASLLSEDNPEKIEIILVGADALANDGSFVNKVGTYGIALAASNNNIPFYVLAVLLKLDKRTLKNKPIPIEQRPPSEIWQNPPPKLEISNPAFDLVPARFITAYITESGIIKPETIEQSAFKEYPFLRK